MLRPREKSVRPPADGDGVARDERTTSEQRDEGKRRSFFSRWAYEDPACASRSAAVGVEKSAPPMARHVSRRQAAVTASPSGLP